MEIKILFMISSKIYSKEARHQSGEPLQALKLYSQLFLSQFITFSPNSVAMPCSPPFRKLSSTVHFMSVTGFALCIHPDKRSGEQALRRLYPSVCARLIAYVHMASIGNCRLRRRESCYRHSER